MRFWLLNASEQLSFAGSQRRRMRTGLLARALLARGHEVTWWKSTFEHVSKSHLRTSDGFEEVEAGLTVGWIHSRGYRKHVSLARALDHRELGRRFPLLAKERPIPDALVCSLPVPELALAGVRFGERHKVPVVVDIRDWWPDALLYTFPRVIRPALELALGPYFRMVAEACRGATAITGITAAFVNWGLSRAERAPSGLDRAFSHGYEVQVISESDAELARRYWDGLGVCADGSRINVAFIGSVSRTFDFYTILSAARILSGTRPGVTFVICGDGDRLPAVRTQAEGLSNVVFTGTWVGPAEIQELLRRAMVGLVPLPNRPDFLATVNNKTVEYLSAGVPVVVSPEESWVGELASQNDFGLQWDGANASALASAIEQMVSSPAILTEMGLRARRYYEEHFVADTVYSEFAEFLERLPKTFE